MEKERMFGLSMIEGLRRDIMEQSSLSFPNPDSFFLCPWLIVIGHVYVYMADMYCCYIYSFDSTILSSSSTGLYLS